VAADYLCFEEAARNPSFDRRMGTDTAGIIPLWRLNVPQEKARLGIRYEPSPPKRFAFALGLLTCDFSKFTFLDLGCGKGRALLMAAPWGFAKVVGVEFSPEMAAIARRNCLIAGCPNIEVITADARDITPPSGNLLLYMYNPFELPVMRCVLDNLLASRRREAGELYIVYLTPRCARLFDAERRFRKVFRAPSLAIWSLTR
jgi:SAM-dependent methyltransferase